jgi:hypothetical protein
MNRKKMNAKNKLTSYRISCLLLIIFLISFSACIGIQKNFKGIEPSARPLTAKKYEILEPAEFQVSSFRLFWFFPVTPGLNIYETIDDTVSRKGGDNLIDMQVWHERQYWILGTIDIVHINGKIIKTLD